MFCFVFALTFPGVAYQPHSSMTVAAAFVADVDRWLIECAGWEDFCFLFSLFTASCTVLLLITIYYKLLYTHAILICIPSHQVTYIALRDVLFLYVLLYSVNESR